jgi:hypothetical protein
MSERELTPMELPPPPGAATPVAPAPKRRGSGLTIGILVVVVSVVAGALVFVFTGGGSDAEAVPLGLAFTEGQSETYVMHTTMNGDVKAPTLGSETLDMDMTQTVTWNVVDVAEDGTATIEVDQTDVSGTVNGSEIPSSTISSRPIEMRIASDGRILSAGGLSFADVEQTQGASFPGMGQITPLLPDGPVSPGDSWEKHFSQAFPFGEGTIDFTATSTLEGYEDVDGVHAAKITTEYTVPLDFTLDLGDLLAAMGDSLGVTGPTGADLALIAGASIAYGGSGEFSMTAWVDTEAKEMLRSSSTGTFDMTMTFEGVPGFDGEVTLQGMFTQDVERG